MTDSSLPVLLTGVARKGQVGEVVAAAFAAQGTRVLLLDREGATAEERAEELRATGGDAHAFGCDLSDASDLARVTAAITPLAPQGLGGLVHVAGGFAMSGSIADSDPAVWERQFSINLTTAYLTTRSFLPLLRQGKGAIVYFASAAALPGGQVANMSAYAAAKSGVITFMQAVAQEESEHGVRANALAPTAIRTAANLGSMGDGVRYVERETVADFIVFLCSPAASAISGQVIRLA